MERINKILVLIFLIIIALFISIDTSQSIQIQRNSQDCYCNYYRTVRGPIPGKIIVAISQTKNEADHFITINKKVRTKFSRNILSNLNSYGLLKARKAFHTRNKGILSLNI